MSIELPALDDEAYVAEVWVVDQMTQSLHELLRTLEFLVECGGRVDVDDYHVSQIIRSV